MGVVLSLGSAPAGACHAESLYDALALAYQTNPLIRGQRAQVKADNEILNQAKAAMGPQVSFTGQATYQGAWVQTPSFFTTHTQTQGYGAGTGSADLSLVQPLYASGAIRAQVRGARDALGASQEDFRYSEAQLMQAVIVAYADVQRDREIVKILTDESANLNAEAGEIGARSRVGQLSRADSDEAQGRLLSINSQLLLARGRLEASNAEYQNLVGQSPGQLEPLPDLRGLPKSLDEALRVASDNNPQLSAARAREKAASEKIRQERGAGGFSVSLKVDAASAPYAPYIAHQYDQNVTGAIVVSKPIFTSGYNSAKIRQAIDEDERAVAAIDATERDVRQAVSQAWSQAQASAGSADVSEKQAAAQSEVLKGDIVEQRAGVRPTIDLLNAELELANARMTQSQNRHDVSVAQAAILAAMGLLEVKRLVPGFTGQSAVAGSR